MGFGERPEEGRARVKGGGRAGERVRAEGRARVEGKKESDTGRGRMRKKVKWRMSTG